MSGEENPEQNAVVLGERGYETCQHDERYQERKHAGPHTQRNARFLLQSISRNDRIGYQGIGSHDAAQQEGSPDGIVQQPDAHAEGEEEGNETGEQTIDDEPRFVLLHTLHVHLQGGEEHDVIESHLAEQLERCSLVPGYSVRICPRGYPPAPFR